MELIGGVSGRGVSGCLERSGLFMLVGAGVAVRGGFEAKALGRLVCSEFGLLLLKPGLNCVEVMPPGLLVGIATRLLGVGVRLLNESILALVGSLVVV
jgi:hypothetical protein